jgi:hypothetical protein
LPQRPSASAWVIESIPPKKPSLHEKPHSNLRRHLACRGVIHRSGKPECHHHGQLIHSATCALSLPD